MRNGWEETNKKYEQIGRQMPWSESTFEFYQIIQNDGDNIDCPAYSIAHDVIDVSTLNKREMETICQRAGYPYLRVYRECWEENWKQIIARLLFEENTEDHKGIFGNIVFMSRDEAKAALQYIAGIAETTEEKKE